MTPPPRGAARPHETAWQRVAGYDWKAVRVPELGAWRPTDCVSVVIPAYNCQDKLDLTLAALAHQRYPAELLEVVVVDDGSEQPLRLRDVAPANSRVLRLEREHEWGRARACSAGAAAADGEILLFLDADMVAYPDHVAAHARWHHVLEDAVTLGNKLFVDFDGITVADVVAAARSGSLSELAAGRRCTEHEWVEHWITQTNDLTQHRPALFMAAVGATVGMRTDLYGESGGLRTHLRAGEDMELAYRLMTAGAVFIPDRQARSWHQGSATFMSQADEVRRRNNPNFANYIPIPGPFRPWTPGRQYAVPMVAAIVQTTGHVYEDVKACVDTLLGSDETDLRVALEGAPETDEMQLVRALYRDEPRVCFRAQATRTGFPSRYTLFAPEWAGFEPQAVPALVERIERERLGVVHVVVRGVAPDQGIVTLYRTAALHRARRARGDEEPLDAVAGRLFGERWIDGAEVGVFDLRSRRAPVRPLKRPSTSSLLRQRDRARRRWDRRRERLRSLRREHTQLEHRHRALQAKYDKLRGRRAVQVALRLDRVRRAVSRSMRRVRGRTSTQLNR